MKSHLALRCSKDTHKEDFVKSLYFEYKLPKQTALSTTYLNAETAKYYIKIEDQSKNLTLAQFNEEQIIKVIENIEENKSIVTDVEAAMQAAKKSIKNKYPYIMTVRCIAHHIKDIISIECAQDTIQKY
ncbi:hypothetical protein C1645_838953 [Glomus cerebriforme]|uniref:DUF659 domain-containing protein n=1 Tax=Glomus cerebriforme TaxID=658196 RepID=A0A397S6G4_9GLOM|nr:hypothetical protein C1645_838953 [Glomus cerebriforme]